MTDLVFLDVETTGLEPDKHEMWEIAWAINDGSVMVRQLRHNGVTADPKALQMNGYSERAVWDVSLRSDMDVRTILEGKTIVCANPTFDRMFMRARWGYEPYRYRSIDIESMALLLFGWERPRGLADIAVELTNRGYLVTMPDHSARKDVESLRDCYTCLRIEADKYKNL